MTPEVSAAVDLSYFTPSYYQIGLALVCIWIVSKMRIVDHFPWIDNYTDSAPMIVSTLLAVLATMVFHWKEMLVLIQTDKAGDLTTLGKDFGLQWVCQQGIYRIGFKDALKNFFRMLGIGPRPVTSVAEFKASQTLSDGTKIQVETSEKSTVTPPMPTDPPKE